MTDFDNWWSWYTKMYPSTKLTVERARKAYDDFYFCKCESCSYRKEHGQIPIYAKDQGCQLPPTNNGLKYVPEDYGLEYTI